MPVLSRCLRSEEHTSELQSPCNIVCRLLLEKKNHTTLKVVFVLNTPTRAIRLAPLIRELSRVPERLQFFFFIDTATTEIYTLSLHDALPIWRGAAADLGPMACLIIRDVEVLVSS